MQAVRVHPAAASSTPYSPSNPAPPSALQLDQDIPIPEPSGPGDLLVRVQATTVIRDSLTWPETYHGEYAILGNDVAGVVEKVGPGSAGRFKAGDEVFGMAHPTRASTWAGYTIMKEDEVAPKPSNLSWEQAAAMPLSALTAYEALFVHAGLPEPDFLGSETQRQSTTAPSQKPKSKPRQVLITGAAGGVGIYLVQLARIAGLEVVAASGSNVRNGSFLERLGADQTVEYGQLKEVPEKYDLIIDTVGGDVLAGCWSLVGNSGTLITVDSLSFGFVEEHARRGLSEGKESVKALFFIVSGGRGAMEGLAGLAQLGLLLPFVVETFPLDRAREAYERASAPSQGHGKVVLTV